jgi:hypothetical protein
VITPTADDVRSWSLLPFEEYGYPEQTGDDTLQELVDRSTEYVTAVTGRTYPDMPIELEATAREATQRRVEQLVIQAQEDYVETGGDFDQISSWNVTGYSETRRGAEDAKKAKLINPWPHLHDLLWMLATPDKQDEWEDIWGMNRPAFEVTEVDWEQTGVGDNVWNPGA